MDAEGGGVLSNALSLLATIFGIGAVIAIHELGHFLAALRLGVRVETFSLGFGPRILGFTRKGILYKIGLVPFGGYVKMAGELVSEATAGAPDEFPSKSIPVRAAIVSAGVAMNFLLAFAIFPIAFAMGISFPAPIVGDVVPGGPAWRARLEPGDEILTIDGEPIYEFSDVVLASALAGEEAITIRARRGAEEITRPVRPEWDAAIGIGRIGIDPAIDPRIEVVPGGAGARAGLRSGDRLVAVNGRALTTERLGRALRGGTARLAVERDGERIEAVVAAADGETSPQPLVGFAPPENRVKAVRDTSRAGMSERIPLRAGDLLLGIDGIRIFSPEDLEEGVGAGDPAAPRVLKVRRGDDILEIPLAFEEPEARERFLSALAIEADQGGATVVLRPGSAASRAGLESGDRILQVNGAPVESWAEIKEGISSEPGKAVTITYSRGPAHVATVTVTPEPVPSPDYGIRFAEARVERSYSLFGAVGAGLRCSWNLIVRQYVFLKQVLTGRVSSKHLGGALTIGYSTYTSAQEGFERFLFFLGVLSISLAVINLLPIPFLDGGTLVLLMVEKVKGSPVNEKALHYFQLTGLLLLTALVLYVTFNDVERFFFSK